jgi:hypothetical protein
MGRLVSSSGTIYLTAFNIVEKVIEEGVMQSLFLISEMHSINTVNALVLAI